MKVTILSVEEMKEFRASEDSCSTAMDIEISESDGRKHGGRGCKLGKKKLLKKLMEWTV